ncbi:MAG: LLM class F420-dependent oxidoreductase [Chloroflexi bacterium]|nr:LLM class F420-dependent oxidoreductase [Chloroflexota bacterium]
MKLGITLGYGNAQINIPIERIQLAERLGYDAVWTAEAYGSDAVTPLAFIAGQTKRIKLATGVIQLAARTPANAAMSFGTIDAMAGGGRVICGIGVSGPQIVEGWYGQPWGKPYYRLRDYIQIMRKIFKRQGPVTHTGREISLPFKGEGSVGLGKPLFSILHMNPDIPIWMGSGGEATTRLVAELCEGWLPHGWFPGAMEMYRPLLEEGFRRAGNGKSLKDFEIQASVGVHITDDVKATFQAMKPGIARGVGGMGAREINFHTDAMKRRGFAEQATRIQELFLDGRKEEAAATVPDEYCDATALIGNEARIRERYQPWADSGVTGLRISSGNPKVIELMAKVADLRPME